MRRMASLASLSSGLFCSAAPRPIAAFHPPADGGRCQGDQLYNSYGAHKSCQALLFQYGFVGPGPVAPILMDLAVLPSKPKLQALEVCRAAVCLPLSTPSHATSPIPHAALTQPQEQMVALKPRGHAEASESSQ